MTPWDWLNDNSGAVQGIAAIVSILVLLALALVTRRYAQETERIAKATDEQAKAGGEMAQEMRRSRQDESRPVIDLRPVSTEEFGRGREEVLSALRALWTEEYSWCTFNNIGKGPALNIAGEIRGNGEVRTELLDTLAVDGQGGKRPFAVIGSEEQFIYIQYQDVYGRQFYSRRPIVFAENGLRFGALETGEVVS